MKKIFFTFLFLAVMSLLSAQSLQFEYEGTVYEDGQTIICPFSEDFGEYLQEMHIRNLSDGDLDVTVAREIIENADGAMLYFCWGMCFSPEVDTSSRPVTIPAQSLAEEDLSFHCMFTAGETGVTKVRYVAFDQNNPENQVSIIVLSGASANVAESHISLGQAYPNPATSQVHFDYSCNGSSVVNAVVYNLLGQEVKSQSVNGSQGRINIAVDDLQPGIYFCSILVNGTTAKTEKFIVKR